METKMYKDDLLIRVYKGRTNVSEFECRSIDEAVNQVIKEYRTYDATISVHIYTLASKQYFELGVGEYAQLLQVRQFNPCKKYHRINK